MSTRRWLVLGVVLAAACQRPPTDSERRTVERWLLCEECVDGELDSVVALGDRALPLLKAALEGPPADRRANMRLQAEAMYTQIRDTSNLVGRQPYVAYHTDNYVASYQSRAATALQRIGTADARVIILDALRQDSLYRSDVRRAIGNAAGATFSLVTGDSQHAPLDSILKINPTVLVRDSSTGTGIKGVLVRSFVDSGGGMALDSVQRTDSAGEAVVRWRLGPSPNDSVNLLRIVAAGRAVRVRAKGHPGGARLVFLTQPIGAKVGQPLVPPVRIAVQDAWGATQTSFNQPLTLTVLGSSDTTVHNLVAGLAHLPGLSFAGPGTGFRLSAKTAGAAPAESDSFSIVP